MHDTYIKIKNIGVRQIKIKLETDKTVRMQQNITGLGSKTHED